MDIKKRIDELVEIIECPRDYFTIELINNTFIMDGEVILQLVTKNMINI